MFSILLLLLGLWLVTLSREQGSEKVGCNRGPKSFAWFCFGFVFPSSFFQYIEFIQTHSVTRAVCWLPDQSHLNMQKVRSECGRSEWATPALPTCPPSFPRQSCAKCREFPPCRQGRNKANKGLECRAKVVAPPQIACKLVKVWIYVRNIVCSCYALAHSHWHSKDTTKWFSCLCKLKSTGWLTLWFGQFIIFSWIFHRLSFASSNCDYT